VACMQDSHCKAVGHFMCCKPDPPAATSRAVATALSIGAVAAIATAWSTGALVVIRLDALAAGPAGREVVPGVTSKV
jgi:hypothetical protein